MTTKILQWATREATHVASPVKFGEALVVGNPEPSLNGKVGEGVETSWQAPELV